MTRALSLCAAFLLALVACGGGDEPAAPRPGTDTEATEPPPSIAENVEVDQVAVLQATTALLFDEAEARAERNAPVIAQRPGLLRVHARPKKRRIRTPPLVAEVRLRSGGEEIVLRDGPKRLVTLDEGDPSSAFVFELPPERVTADATLSITISDPASPAPGAVFPADGTAFPLEAKDSAPALRVKFVPIRYDNDGSQRLPDLSERRVAYYRDELYKMYPVSRVEVSVREQLVWPLLVDSRGEGWDALLDAVMDLRVKDAAPDDEYYVGVFTPAENIQSYCQGGCILGVAPQAGPRDISLRAAMIVGFGMGSEGGTLAQELAHAMGRAHAPCGNPGALDYDFPYGAGGIGVWGWDVLSKELVSPSSRVHDFMSYCSPVWVSDYTYKGVFDRMDFVAKSKRPEATPTTTPPAADPSARPAARTMRSFRLAADGALVEGPRVEVLAGGETEPGAVDVSFEDAAGRLLERGKGFDRGVRRLGGRLLLPEAPPGAARARIAGLGEGPRALVRAAR